MLKRCSTALGLLLIMGSTASAKLPTQGTVHHVTISGIKFNPETVELKKGEVIEWKNDDLVPHTVTDEADGIESGTIPPEKTWRYRSKKAGIFAYICRFHPTMKGTMVVR